MLFFMRSHCAPQVQVHAALGALVRDNGQDYQRAFLEGEGVLGLLQPGQAPKAKQLLGLANKDKAHAATRAGDRTLQARPARLGCAGCAGRCARTHQCQK